MNKLKCRTIITQVHSFIQIEASSMTMNEIEVVFSLNACSSGTPKWPKKDTGTDEIQNTTVILFQSR